MSEMTCSARSVARAPVPLAAVPGWLRLAGALLAIGATWLVVLPWLGCQPPLARHIAHQESRGIDPSALYYSELEILPPIVHRIERLHGSHRADFWGR